MNAWGHFRTVVRHRHAVYRLCRKAGIGGQGLLHDLSKFSPTEFLSGARFYTDGTASPNVGERALRGYSAAWLHHKGRNRHHFEYWQDYSTRSRRVVSVKMPMKYVAELICDRVAASKIYRGKDYTDSYPLEYFMRGKKSRKIHKQTSDYIEEMLTLLAEKGEDEAFRVLREDVKKGDYGCTTDRGEDNGEI